MDKPTSIIIHCSYTKSDQDISADTIREWHFARGWSDIGYHWVIRRDGTIEAGRPENRTGAHTQGHNNSIGVCLVGGMSDDREPLFNFNHKQLAAMAILIADIKLRHGDDLPVVGHRDFEGVKKACPCFDVRAWLE